MAKFTPEEALQQGRLDMMAVNVALCQLEAQFGPLSQMQKYDITAELLYRRYETHIAAGRLDTYNPAV